MAEFKIDMHIHTKEFSNCSIATPEELIDSAIQKGLNGAVFTEHDIIFSPSRLEELNLKYTPFKIFAGIEVTIKDKDKNVEHIVVLGLQDKALEGRKWNYSSLYNYVKKRNGYLILAHPYRYRDYLIVDVENCPPDAVEIFSSNLDEVKLHKRLELCKNINVKAVTNSDAHSIDIIGRYYNILEETPENEEDLIRILNSGKFKTLL